MKKTGFLVLAASACLFAAAANAEEGDDKEKGMRHQPPAFADVDANGDGVIVAEELYAMQAKRMAERAKEGGKMRNAANHCKFEDVDADADGKVSPEEFAAHHAGRHERHRHGHQ